MQWYSAVLATTTVSMSVNVRKVRSGTSSTPLPTPTHIQKANHHHTRRRQPGKAALRWRACLTRFACVCVWPRGLSCLG